MVDKMAPLGSTGTWPEYVPSSVFGGSVRRWMRRRTRINGDSVFRRDIMSVETRALESARVIEGFAPDWASRGACRTSDPDALFVQGAAQNRAKAVCMGCAVRTECLADALDNRVEFGVWGGMTERERRALLRRRPNVSSWRRLLEAARAEHERSSPSTAQIAVRRLTAG